MLAKTKLNFYRFFSAFLLAAMLSMSGVMYVSAHGGDVTLIHACVNNHNGSVRIVSPTTACDANRETALDWSIQGPKGDKGDVGPAGPQGPQWPAGERGFYTNTLSITVPVGNPGTAIPTCAAGDQAISGGVDGLLMGDLSYVMKESYVVFYENLNTWGWATTVYNNTNVSLDFTASVLCADTTP